MNWFQPSLFCFIFIVMPRVSYFLGKLGGDAKIPRRNGYAKGYVFS